MCAYTMNLFLTQLFSDFSFFFFVFLLWFFVLEQLLYFFKNYLKNKTVWKEYRENKLTTKNCNQIIIKIIKKDLI